MSPHPQDTNDSGVFVDLIKQAVLNVDMVGIRALKIADEFFVSRRILKRILPENIEKFLDVFPQTGAFQIARVF